jgi:hypothetical protein
MKLDYDLFFRIPNSKSNATNVQFVMVMMIMMMNDDSD